MKKQHIVVSLLLLLCLVGCKKVVVDTDNSQQTEVPKQTEMPKQTEALQEEKDEIKLSSTTYENRDFSLEYPDEWWPKHLIVQTTSGYGDTEWAAFYEKTCHEELDAGWLFSIAGFKDNSYEDQPSYDVIETDGDITYVVIYPTDVQFDGASKKAQKRYQKMASQIEDVIATFQKK